MKEELRLLLSVTKLKRKLFPASNTWKQARFPDHGGFLAIAYSFAQHYISLYALFLFYDTLWCTNTH